MHQPMRESQVPPLDREDPLGKEMATHSNILAWEIPWTEEPGGLHSVHGPIQNLVGSIQSMGPFRHDSGTRSPPPKYM